MNLSLSGKRAFVCGSTNGIGKAIAKELAGLGATVTLVARNEQMLTQTLHELDTPNGQAHDYLVADFSAPKVLKNKVEAYLARTNAPIHILVNNTGGPPAGKILDADLEEFYHAYKMHVACNHLLCQALAPGMQQEGYGRIINIISTSVRVPIPGLGVSNTTRGAVAAWAKTLSNELAPYGITVNNVLPGFTRTDRLYSIIKTRGERNRTSPEIEEQKMISTVPAGRFGDVEEVAAMATFLATPAAAYVNGVSIPVDGGRTGCI